MHAAKNVPYAETELMKLEQKIKDKKIDKDRIEELMKLSSLHNPEYNLTEYTHLEFFSSVRHFRSMLNRI